MKVKPLGSCMTPPGAPDVFSNVPLALAAPPLPLLLPAETGAR